MGDFNNTIALPTLSPEALTKLLATATMETYTDDMKMLYDLTYDDNFIYKKYTPVSASTIQSVFKSNKIVGMPSSEDGTKINANSKTLLSLVSQSAVGKTGIMIKLIHSGFSIKLKPITANEKIVLEYNIAESIIRAHRLLLGDLNSAIYFNIIEQVMSFLISKLDYTTMELGRKEDIVKYIRVKDINLILAGILYGIYTDGYRYKYTCTETIEVEDGEDVCAKESEEVILDMEKLLYITADLTEAQVEQLNKTGKDSIKKPAVLAYQENLEANKPEKVTIEDLEYTLDDGTVYNYIQKSKRWFSAVISKNQSFDRDDINGLVNIINSSMVGKYYYTIAKIENEAYSGTDIDIEIVNTLSSNGVIAEAIITNAKLMLSKTCYTIGVPRYTCPSCAKDSNKTSEEHINSINLLSLFITLV